MTVKITRLKLTGYKSVANADVAFGDLNVLIGANGAGKSNLLSFFHLLTILPPSSDDETPRPAALDGDAVGLLHDGPQTTGTVTAEIGFLAAGEPALCRLTLTLDPVGGGALAVRRTEPARLAGVCDAALTGAFHHIPSHAAPVAVANLAALLLGLRDDRPKYYRRIVESVRQMAPFFDDFVLEAANGAVGLRWREFDADMVFEASQASDGLLRLVALTVALLQPPDLTPPVLIFDEPELGLHPHAVVIIGGLIRAAAVDRQVIVATQSPLLLDQFAAENVIVAERVGRATAFRRLDLPTLREWLEDYTLGELWRKNVLGGQPESDGR